MHSSVPCPVCQHITSFRKRNRFFPCVGKFILGLFVLVRLGYHIVSTYGVAWKCCNNPARPGMVLSVTKIAEKEDLMKVKIIRSNRKSYSIQVNSDLSVTIRAPRRATDKEIGRILKEKQSWILKQERRIREQKNLYEELGMKPLTREEIEKLADQAVEYIPGRVEYFAKKEGISYGRITIRNQKTRWGSCSSRGNLNFNCLLMLAPPEVIDYVVVHELCHRRQMNHQKAFWDEVEKILPEYKKSQEWLKEEGSILMKRMTGEIY